MIFYTLPWRAWNNSYIITNVRSIVRVSRIRSEISWSSTHTKIWTMQQLHHCTQRLNHKDISMLCFLTPLAVIKEEKNCKESRWRSQSALVDLKPSECHVRCKNVIGSYASTRSIFNLIGSFNRNRNTQSHKDTKIQSHKDTYAQTTDISYKS